MESSKYQDEYNEKIKILIGMKKKVVDQLNDTC
jgi:hypothetical protein